MSPLNKILLGCDALVTGTALEQKYKQMYTLVDCVQSGFFVVIDFQ